MKGRKPRPPLMSREDRRALIEKPFPQIRTVVAPRSWAGTSRNPLDAREFNDGEDVHQGYGRRRHFPVDIDY